MQDRITCGRSVLGGRTNMIRKTGGDFMAYWLLVLPLAMLILSSCHSDEQPSGIEGAEIYK